MIANYQYTHTFPVKIARALSSKVVGVFSLSKFLTNCSSELSFTYQKNVSYGNCVIASFWIKVVCNLWNMDFSALWQANPSSSNGKRICNLPIILFRTLYLCAIRDLWEPARPLNQVHETNILHTATIWMWKWLQNNGRVFWAWRICEISSSSPIRKCQICFFRVCLRHC